MNEPFQQFAYGCGTDLGRIRHNRGFYARQCRSIPFIGEPTIFFTTEHLSGRPL